MVVAWTVVGVGAAILRLILLDRLPLAEAEAVQAFAAWQASQGQLGSSLAATGSPLLGHALTLLFWLFGASDGLARMVSVVAGVALVLSPAIFIGLIGARAAFWAVILIAVSPLAVEVSRSVDGAALTAALAMIVVGSCARLLTDSPRWAPWTLALGLGLAPAHDSSVVLALTTAGLVALFTWTPSVRQVSAWLEALRGARAPIAFGLATAVVAGTGALMDLGGLGTPLGPLWSGLGSMLRPAPLPSRNLMAVAAYGSPLLLLATVGVVQAWRRRYPLGMFLGEWTLVLLVLAAIFEPMSPVLVLLPVGPAALLAGMGLRQLPLGREAYRLSGASCAILTLTVVAEGAFLVVGGQAFGGTNAINPIAIVLAVGVLAATIFFWVGGVPSLARAPALLLTSIIRSMVQSGFRVPSSERAPALVLLGAGTFAALTVSGICRLSYGGSPLGTELIARETTDPQFRAAFQELTVLASADKSRALVYDAATPMVARWYGRSIEQIPFTASASRRPIAFQQAPPPGNQPVAQGERVPWKVESQVNRDSINLLGVGSWLISRARLVDGKPRDIIIIQ